MSLDSLKSEYPEYFTVGRASREIWDEKGNIRPEAIKSLQESINKTNYMSLTPQEEATFLFQKWYKIVRKFGVSGMRDVAYTCAIEEVMGLLTEHSLLHIKDGKRTTHLEKVLEVLKDSAK